MNERRALVLFILVVSLFLSAVAPDAYADEARNTASDSAKRISAEFGFGTLFGAVAGGTALVAGVFANPTDVCPTFISSAILYPAGVASGAILGGWLTDSRSGYWQPFVGAYVGAIVADLTAYFLSDEYPVFCAILVLTLPVITTMVATETSHYRKGAAKPEARPGTVMPLTIGFEF